MSAKLRRPKDCFIVNGILFAVEYLISKASKKQLDILIGIRELVKKLQAEEGAHNNNVKLLRKPDNIGKLRKKYRQVCRELHEKISIFQVLANVLEKDSDYMKAENMRFFLQFIKPEKCPDVTIYAHTSSIYKNEPVVIPVDNIHNISEYIECDGTRSVVWFYDGLESRDTCIFLGMTVQDANKELAEAYRENRGPVLR